MVFPGCILFLTVGTIKKYYKVIVMELKYILLHQYKFHLLCNTTVLNNFILQA